MYIGIHYKINLGFTASFTQFYFIKGLSIYYTRKFLTGPKPIKNLISFTYFLFINPFQLILSYPWPFYDIKRLDLQMANIF